MATYDHLPLKRLSGTLERRKHGFGNPPQRDAKVHGSRIREELEATVESYGVLPAVDGVDPALILKVSAATPIQEDEWRKLGMVLLSSDGDNSVVLFANDKTLTSFKSKVEAYQKDLPPGQKSPSYAGLVSAIDAVGLLQPRDRIGLALQAAGFVDPSSFDNNGNYLLDVELHYPPDEDDAPLYQHRLDVVVRENNGRVLSTYRGLHLFLARIEGPASAVKAILELPEVAKVDLPPSPDFLTEDVATIDLSAVTARNPPPNDAITIGIVDSGVNFGHPLLAGAEAGSISLDPSGSVADERGHGTQVASIAAFGDIALRVQSDDFQHQFRIASARVLDGSGSFLKDRSMADIMDEAITKLHEEYGCRIFNISLGDERRPFNGGKVDAWSASLDQLARALDVVIVVSAGNRKNLTVSFADRIGQEYPAYLTQDGSRLIEPGTAALVLTVGAIAHSNGIDEDDIDYVGVRAICERDEPAPFTRCGPGIKGMVKPELVDFGGTAVWDGPTQQIVTGSIKSKAGVWAFSHDPINRLFVARSGTSFSAPNVAYKAALLLSKFPRASANLVRALLGLSASVPPAALNRTGGLDARSLHQVCGHGVANAVHAATSDDSRVVFYSEEQIELDHFAVFEVPIPKEFQETKGAREIRVSLAYDPPTRHTRIDYFGVTMEWRLLRGSSAEEVYDRFRKWDKEEGNPPEFADKFVCPVKPSHDLRGFGTLQAATYTGRKNISSYGDKYFVAVWALRRWAPADIKLQKFALAVQLRHENVTTLYAKVRQPVRV